MEYEDADNQKIGIYCLFWGAFMHTSMYGLHDFWRHSNTIDIHMSHAEKNLAQLTG